MRGRPIPYSAEELAFVQSVSKWPRAQAHAAFCEKFARDDVSLTSFNALCKRNGWMTGRTGRIVAGNVPHNKGKKCEPGRGGNHPNARRTQFKKGELSSRAAALYKPVGTERLNDDGYRERKMHDGEGRRWKLAHVVDWEAANGPIPVDHCLKCRDGNRLNCAPSNWELIPRALLPRLAGGNQYCDFLAYDEAAPELRPAIMTMAKIDHRMRQIRQGER